MRFRIYILGIFFLFGNIKLSSQQTNGEFWWKTPGKSPILEKPVAISPADNLALGVEGECCECTLFYLCINGTIDISGAGLLDPRIGGVPSPKSTAVEPTVSNVIKCPTAEEICCRLPDAEPSCMDKLTATPAEPLTKPVDDFTPSPDSNCECIVYDSCIPDLVVNDGLGNTTILLTNGKLVSHSKCRHPLEVCCFLPDLSLFETTPSVPVKTSDEDQCECVEKSLCGPDGHILTTGVGLLDVRFGSSNAPKPCPFDSKLVCCLPPKVNPSIVTTPTPILETTVKPTTPPHAECGQRNSHGVGVRILGFQEGQAQFGEFPWVVNMVRKELIMGKVYPLFVGGGSLIHQRVVMTAAHKLTGIKLEDLLIRLGEWDTASTKEVLPFQEVAVQEIIVHEGFNSQTLANDIALLILKEDANLNYHIATICPAKDLKNINSKACVVNGWGTDAYRTGKYQHIMKSVQLPLVAHGICQSLLRKTRLSKFFVLQHSFLCAGGEQGKDACMGDGGGPLSCPLLDNPSKHIQVGITAWGIGCGEKDVPGVYVNIPSLYQWIEDNVEKRYPGYKTAFTSAAQKAPVALTNNNKQVIAQKRKEEREAMRKIREEERKIKNEERMRQRNQNKNAKRTN